MALAACNAAPAPSPALRDEARLVLERNCGECHVSAYPTAREGALAVFDLNGARVRTLVEGFLASGPHEVVWDARDDAGRSVGPGLYFVRLLRNGQPLMARFALQ